MHYGINVLISETISVLLLAGTNCHDVEDTYDAHEKCLSLSVCVYDL